WLTTVEMQSYFESTGGYRQYIAEAKKKRSQPPEGFEKVTFDSQQSSKMLVVKQEPVGPRMEVERALAAVQVVSGCTREEMLEQRRGRGGNPYKALAVWWLIHGAGLSNIEAGAVLNLSPTAVSHILMKLRQNPSTYVGGRVWEWIQLLKAQ
ncbi:MAG: hypothetical protein QNJ97_24785, partial [Myxococcota bacterium]|nr:hypothetical protein [Myxococcota bacterium]